MISINPPYTNMIFGGIKPMEFRKKVLNEVLKRPPQNMYFCELIQKKRFEEMLRHHAQGYHVDQKTVEETIHNLVEKYGKISEII